MSEAKEFTIKRSEWARGNIDGGSATLLLSKVTNLKCCLGFYGMACGAEEYAILDQFTPTKLQEFWPAWLFERDYASNGYGPGRYDDKVSAYYELTNINDELKIDEEVREAKVIDVFARHGVTVNFVD